MKGNKTGFGFWRLFSCAWEKNTFKFVNLSPTESKKEDYKFQSLPHFNDSALLEIIYVF